MGCIEARIFFPVCIVQQRWTLILLSYILAAPGRPQFSFETPQGTGGGGWQVTTTRPCVVCEVFYWNSSTLIGHALPAGTHRASTAPMQAPVQSLSNFGLPISPKFIMRPCASGNAQCRVTLCGRHSIRSRRTLHFGMESVSELLLSIWLRSAEWLGSNKQLRWWPSASEVPSQSCEGQHYFRRRNIGGV